MAVRAPLCSLLFRYSQTEQNEGALARKDKPRAKTVPVNRREHIMSISSNIEPQSYKEAAKHPCWVQAMKDESVALVAN